MGLRKKSKVSAEFSMSSLTDIIFLLLIFFMLTSSLVAPNALNLKLPGSSATRVTSTSKLDNVAINKSGRIYLNGKRMSLYDLETQLRRKSRAQRGKLDITISPAKGVATEHVVGVMDVAMRLNINGILITDLD
ncbi:MAG: biopolymer transporter ExbD [Bacteroidetes bacterium]|nr:biopolymer transporter ExbD [Bacteroidota bacterium]